MNFKVSARVVTQLGAELISSDDIAVYELVKNGFDAGSESVEVSITYRISTALVKSLQEPVLRLLDNTPLRSECPKDIKAEVIERVKTLSENLPQSEFCILTPEHFSDLLQRISKVDTCLEILCAIGKLNCIDIVDFGTGMSALDVEQYYLTIGTTHRLRQVEAIESTSEVAWMPSGEKGIGRLSAMRLGKEVELYTVPKDSPEAVMVSIHWREFDHRRDDDLGSIPIDLETKSKGADANGTFISIFDLSSDWSREKAVKLGTVHLAKFIDPFPGFDGAIAKSLSQQRIVLKWNGETIDTRELIKKYLDHCQNSMLCRLRMEGGKTVFETSYFFGETNSSPAKHFSRDLSIVDFSELTESALATVGAFEFMLYHYPRNRLKAIPQFASRSEVKHWLDRWSGGLMLFRDGIRVLPYATEGDDWLNLDGQALRGRGFRVNRIQVVGAVRISRRKNPNLIDQTNREGLRDNPAFQAFRKIISRLLQENFVSYLDAHLSNEKPDLEHLARRVSEEYDILAKCAGDLEMATKSEDWSLARQASTTLSGIVTEIREVNDSVERALHERDLNRIQVLELASTGMAAESMAHDLEGVIETAISSLNESALENIDKRVSASVRHIRSVHKALLIQLKQISPGPAKSRRRASNFDLNTTIQEVASFYSERLTRHHITLSLPDPAVVCQIHAVNGHVRQIFDNFFRNSIYWLQDTRKRFPKEDGKIYVELDSVAKQVTFSDTGVGIAKEDAEWIFRPFNSRRESGRGLGLFICSELAQFNDIQLKLDPGRKNKWDRLHSFILTFK